MNKGFSFGTFLVFLAVSISAHSQSNMTKTRDKKNTTEFQHASTEIEGKQLSLAADLSALGDNANILFFDNTCIIVGKDGVPYILNTSIEFDPSLLPITLQNSVYSVESISLSLSFESEENTERTEHVVPRWLKDFRDLKYLTLEDVRLDPSFFLKNTGLKHLILVGSSLQDRILLIKHISELKNLDYLVHGDFLTQEEITEIKKCLPELTVLSESEYDKKLENGEIKLPK